MGPVGKSGMSTTALAWASEEKCRLDSRRPRFTRSLPTAVVR